MNREGILVAIFILSFVSLAIYVNAFTVQDLANSLSQIFSTNQNSGTTGGFNFFQWAQNLFTPQTVPSLPDCTTLGSPSTFSSFTCDNAGSTNAGSNGFTCKRSGTAVGHSYCSCGSSPPCTPCTNSPSPGSWPCESSQNTGSLTITIHVQNANTKSAVQGANVNVDGSSKTTDSQGNSQFQVTSGFHNVDLTATNYASGGGTINVAQNNQQFTFDLSLSTGTGTVNPQISVSPSIVNQGNYIVISGSGFTPNSLADIHFTDSKPSGGATPCSPLGDICANAPLYVDSNGRIGSQVQVGTNINTGTQHIVAIDRATGTKSNSVSITVQTSGGFGTTGGLINSITVYLLDSNCNPVQTWVVYSNGLTGLVPNIPVWTGSNNCAGNMRIDYDYTNTGSSSSWYYIATQVHGINTNNNGDTIYTPEQQVSANAVGHHAHWIKMWAENITERNWLYMSTSQCTPGFGCGTSVQEVDFTVLNPSTATSGQNPCTQPGVCWGSNGAIPNCISTQQNAVIGFCVPASMQNSHPDWFITVPSGNYRCGPDFCLIANANDNGCWNTRGFCYSFDQTGTSKTGCTPDCTVSGSSVTCNLAQECQNRGEIFVIQQLAQMQIK